MKAEDYRLKLDVLDHWRPQLEAALSSADYTHTYDDLVGLVMRGEVVLFTYPGCLLVMEIAKYPQFSVWHCFIACGEMEAVLESEKAMNAVAANLGCKYLSFAGRAGWERILKKAGWHTVCVTMYKEVEHHGIE
jgi:hypothetical protein